MGHGGDPQWHRPAPALAEPRLMAILQHPEQDNKARFLLATIFALGCYPLARSALRQGRQPCPRMGDYVTGPKRPWAPAAGGANVDCAHSKHMSRVSRIGALTSASSTEAPVAVAYASCGPSDEATPSDCRFVLTADLCNPTVSPARAISDRFLTRRE